ncbi:MAG: cysteine hydrolase [Chloroflexi bacterium]|nr:cysteine hydrolase [Chloroflexota bacterium]
MESKRVLATSIDSETRRNYLASVDFKKDPRPTVLRTVGAQADPKHSALLIVDVQNNFVHPELCLYKPDGLGKHSKGDVWKAEPLIPRMLENLPKLLQAAREANLLIVFIRATYDPKYLSEPWAFMLERKGLYGDICIEGTPGADFYGDIRPRPNHPREVVVTKHRFSGVWHTDLLTILRSNGIKTVVMTGVATSGCVEATTRDLFFNDFYTITVEDCCAQPDEAGHYSSLDTMGRSYGFVVKYQDLIGLWAKVRQPAMVAND